jgi:small subunit ribosomal protein S29
MLLGLTLLVAISLVNSSSAYQYDMRTQTYSQPTFASQTLRRFLAVNVAALKNMTTQKEVGIERRASLPAGTSLVDLINVGLKDQSVAPTVLEALLSELGSQKE